MPEEKAFLTGLFDLAFEGSLTKKIVRLLYIIFLLGGGVTVVALVVMGFQESPAQGLVYLVSGVEIGRAHAELQSRPHLVCRLLLEKKKIGPRLQILRQVLDAPHDLD